MNRKKIVSLILACAMTLSIFSSLQTTTINATIMESVGSEESAVKKVTLIEGNSIWKYEDTNTDMYSQKFYEKDFDDTTWKGSIGPLGYPAKDSNEIFGAVSEGTLVNSINKPNAIITYYFRNNFTIETLEELSKLEATVGIDDGFVMYINGKEVNRSYMNDGEVTHASEANFVNEPSDAEGTVNLNLTNAIEYLVEGENTIAVSVHNRDANSSDIYFDMNLIATYGEEVQEPELPQPPADEKDENSTPKQVNVHVGEDASSEVNISYTTINEGLETKVLLNKVGDTNITTVIGENSQGNANKYFHKIDVSGLEANTQYEYTVGTGENTYSGTFKTAPAKGSKDPIKFAFIADPQVANATDSEAAGATFNAITEMEGLDFVYIGGDITDKSINETQWELLFNNGGAYSTGGQDMFGNYLIAAAQGNHDNNTLTRHINTPTEAGNIVYSFDFGPATIVTLNLETAKSSATAREEQEKYLREVVAEAKARGQWTFVGFHKSLYTGASHITDSDAIEARKYWVPIFTELDIDVILQGHDHVYSRGFVNGQGYNAKPEVDGQGRVINPENAPLYMVGGHSGGLKWYSKKNYTVGSDDILAPGYEFLDVNSTDTGSDVKKEQVIVELEVSEDELTVNTYMFKYDPVTDAITTDKYLYDTVTTIRKTIDAVEVEDLINNLPEIITLEDKNLVLSARTAYNSLTEIQKSLISEEVLVKLVAAEEKIVQLEREENQQVANQVVEIINNMPENISLKDEEKILSARAAYDELTAEQKALVNEEVLAKLIAAEEKLQQLKVELEVNKEAANKVIELINKIPENISLEEKESILAVREAYNALTAEQKLLISEETLAKLVSAESKISELESNKDEDKEEDKEEDKNENNDVVVKPNDKDENKRPSLPNTGGVNSGAVLSTALLMTLSGVVIFRKKNKIENYK